MFEKHSLRLRSMEENDIVTRSDNEITPVQLMISSCAGAMMTSFIVTPLDVVKVRLQARQNPIPVKNKCIINCAGLVEDICCQVHSPRTLGNPQVSGTVKTLTSIARTEGITSLWSALPTTVLMAVPATVIYFTLYDQIRGYLTKMTNTKDPPMWIPVVGGITARSVCVSVISPLEMIRTKMQSMRLSYSQISQAIISLVRKRGYFAMWHGVGPTMYRDVPFSALYWLNYELLKKKFKQETPTYRFSLMAGAISGTIAAVVTLPFDVVKTHLQVELGDAERCSKSRSSIHLLRELYLRSGYKALYAGIVPRVVKIAPACAIMISSYEYGKQYFRKKNEARNVHL